MTPTNTRYRLIRSSLLAVISTVGLAAAIAATAPPAPPAGQPGAAAGMHGPGPGMRGGPGREGPGREGMRGGRMEMMDPFMRALRDLGLTAEQHDKVHGIMEAAHKSHQAQMRSMGENLSVIGNPGDPGYAAAVQTAKDKAAAMIQHHSDLDKQIYALLTAEQKAKLPRLLADMKAKLDERKEQWRMPSPDHVHDGAPDAPKN